MAFLIDTNIAIHLRDNGREVTDRLEGLGELPLLSVVSSVELEGGVYRHPALTPVRRIRVDEILGTLEVLPFGDPEVLAYRGIVAAAGYARTRILDRMIAATALVQGLTLITMNQGDFNDVPGLALEVWPSPTP